MIADEQEAWDLRSAGFNPNTSDKEVWRYEKIHRYTFGCLFLGFSLPEPLFPRNMQKTSPARPAKTTNLAP